VSRRTVCEVTTVWLGRSDWSRRVTRQRAKRLGSGPIGGGGDSPVTRRAPRYRHDCAPSRGSHQPPPSSSVRADEPFFSASARRISRELRRDLAVALAKAGAATNRSEVPATPLSLRLGGPVSQPLANAWGQTTPPRRAMLRRVDEYRHESRGRARWACPSGLPVANRRA